MISIGFILGNFIKNLYCIPRPPSPVIRIREYDNDDYSFPSTHSLQSVSIPLFLIYFNFKNENELTSTLVLVVGLACMISFCISMSRIYLGAHTLQDVIAGAAVGIIISTLYCTFSDNFEKFLTEGSLSTPITVLIICIILIFIHPVEVFIKNSYGKFNIGLSQNGYITSSGLIGVGMGVCYGSWLIPNSYDTIHPYTHLFNVILRYIVGGMCCVPIYVLTKKIWTTMLMKLWDISKIPLFNPPYHDVTSDKEQEKYEQEAKNSPYKFPFNVLVGSGFQVMPIVKFVQYGSLAFMIMTGCPMIFKAIGI